MLSAVESQDDADCPSWVGAAKAARCIERFPKQVRANAKNGSSTRRPQSWRRQSSVGADAAAAWSNAGISRTRTATMIPAADPRRRADCSPGAHPHNAENLSPLPPPRRSRLICLGQIAKLRRGFGAKALQQCRCELRWDSLNHAITSRRFELRNPADSPATTVISERITTLKTTTPGNRSMGASLEGA